MRKINSLFAESTELDAISARIKIHSILQQHWHQALPAILAESSHIGSLTNGRLTVLADSAIVANKIKLMHASLLNQLQISLKNTPQLKDCKVTAISVKVQVKSRVKPASRTPRDLSKNAALSLKKLAAELGESPLTARLQTMASRSGAAK